MKSALPFNALWVVLILVASLATANAAIRDRYLFRVGDTVIGVNDLAQTDADLAALHCRFPDALLEAWTSDSFRGKFKKVIEKLGTDRSPLAEDQNSIIFLSSVRQLWKLLIYVDGQAVNMSPELQKSVLNVSGCPAITHARGKMRDSFQRWLRLEVYLRSRYAPGGIVKGQEWREKRLQSIAQFVESIDKQLPHENFW